MNNYIVKHLCINASKNLNFIDFLNLLQLTSEKNRYSYIIRYINNKKDKEESEYIRILLFSYILNLNKKYKNELDYFKKIFEHNKIETKNDHFLDYFFNENNYRLIDIEKTIYKDINIFFKNIKNNINIEYLLLDLKKRNIYFYYDKNGGFICMERKINIDKLYNYIILYNNDGNKIYQGYVIYGYPCYGIQSINNNIIKYSMNNTLRGYLIKIYNINHNNIYFYIHRYFQNILSQNLISDTKIIDENFSVINNLKEYKYILERIITYEDEQYKSYAEFIINDRNEFYFYTAFYWIIDTKIESRKLEIIYKLNNGLEYNLF